MKIDLVITYLIFIRKICYESKQIMIDLHLILHVHEENKVSIIYNYIKSKMHSGCTEEHIA